MERVTRDAWEATIEKLGDMPSSKRTHFALMLMNLAECYVEGGDTAGVVLIRKADELLTFSAGATEFEATEIVEHAMTTLRAVAMEDAPPKEMFN